MVFYKYLASQNYDMFFQKTDHMFFEKYLKIGTQLWDLLNIYVGFNMWDLLNIYNSFNTLNKI